jgi:N-methylhydantoinase A
MTVGKGLDPRDFVLFAFGGAGPVHAGVFARELGVAKVVIPQRETASTWCAFGAASADVLHIHEAVDIMASPFDPARIDRNLERLEERARAEMQQDGIAPPRQRFEFALDMRHKGQINEVEVVLDWTRTRAGFETPLKEQFYARYEQLYGRGASFRGARVEIVTYRVRASAETPRPRLVAAERLSATVPAAARRASRPVYWEESGRQAETAVFDGGRLEPGNDVAGPAIVETPDTSVVVRPGQSLAVDRFGNFEVALAR